VAITKKIPEPIERYTALFGIGSIVLVVSVISE